MNVEKLTNLMKMGTLSIPVYLIRNYERLNIGLEEVIILAYLLNNSEVIDYQKISDNLNFKNSMVLDSINKLQEKKLLEIKVSKNEKGIMEEKISLDCFYQKLSLILMDDFNNQPLETENIYQMFEKEFGRTLSPMEYEIITGWLDSKYNEEVIIEALKEAVFNGASNLRYIDKILFEWNKKGIKTLNDVRKDRDKFIKAKKEKIEVPDYNWLEDNE